MKDIYIERTVKTPEVKFNAESGEFLIQGISIPENTVEFYHNIIYWLTEYSASAQERTVLNLRLEYFNTSTSVVLLNIFKMLSEIKNSKVVINWFYEDDDVEMEEVGKDYQKMLNVEFNLVGVEAMG